MTEQCHTRGCTSPSVHVLPYEKILGKIRKALRLCPACYYDRVAPGDAQATKEAS